MSAHSHQDQPLIALVSGVAAAIPPAAAAVTGAMPGATVWNLLDDRLISDAQERGAVTPEMEARLFRLVEHAKREGADAVLLTCSMYSHLAARASLEYGVPVEASDDSAFREVASSGGTVFLVSSVDLALADASARLVEIQQRSGASVRVIPVLAEAARAPSLAGDTSSVAEAIVVAVKATGEHGDRVLLANYSLAHAAREISLGLDLPVLTGPSFAALDLRAQLATLPRSRTAQ
jgi:hypothetical protein